MQKRAQSGQALLIILLIMSVVLTIGLSVVSRSITDIQITTKEDDALRAFSAAEAGIERALIAGTGGAIDSLPSGATATFEVLPTTDTSQFVYPTAVASGDSATFWFDDGKSRNAYFCWGANSAIEITLYGQNNSITRHAYSQGEALVDGDFTSPTGTGCNITDINGSEITFDNSTERIDIDSNTKFARVKVFSNNGSQPIGIESSNNLPSQGSIFESEGSFAEATRKIRVFRARGDVPPIFDYALFAENGSYK